MSVLGVCNTSLVPTFEVLADVEVEPERRSGPARGVAVAMPKIEGARRAGEGVPYRGKRGLLYRPWRQFPTRLGQRCDSLNRVAVNEPQRTACFSAPRERRQLLIGAPTVSAISHRSLRA